MRNFSGYRCPPIAVLSLHSCPLGSLGARDTGGMSVYIRETAVELARLGYKIDIFTRKHGSHGSEIITLAPGVRLVHVEAGREQEVVDKLSLFPHISSFSDAIRVFCRNENINYGLIFSHYWLSGIAGMNLSNCWGVPHVVMFHTLAAIKNRLGAGTEEPALRIDSESRVARGSHKVIVATRSEKQDLVDFYGAKENNISILPCGVNQHLFKPFVNNSDKNNLVDKKKKTILFVGRIEPLKGLDLLFDSLALINSVNDWQCIIAGGGESSRIEIERLKLKAELLGIKEKVVFSGLVPQGKLPYYYNLADVLAVPSYYESFGLVALEALASGCPVVANDVGDLKSIIRSGFSGDVAIKPDPVEFAAKLSHWLNRPPLTLPDKQLIARTVSSYGWNNVCYRLSGEISKMMNVACGIL